MSINFTQQEMADLVFECAVATLKRIDRPYIKILAIIPGCRRGHRAHET